MSGAFPACYIDENKVLFRGLYSISVYWGTKFIKVIINDILMIASGLANIADVDWKDNSVMEVASMIVTNVTNIITGQSFLGHQDFGQVKLGQHIDELKIIWVALDVSQIIRFYGAGGCKQIGFQGSKNIYTIKIVDNIPQQHYATSKDFSKSAKTFIKDVIKNQQICMGFYPVMLTVYGYDHTYNDIDKHTPVSCTA